MERLLSFTRQLEDHSLTYILDAPRTEAIMVIVFVPSAHWEVEFFDDEHVEVERFASDGYIYGKAVLQEILSLGEPPTRGRER